MASSQTRRATQAASSGGLAASLVDVVVRREQITAQVVLVNNTAGRIYLLDARVDDGQRAFLGSGANVADPFPAGIPFCNGSFGDCISNPNNMVLEKFTYIEPGDSLGAALKYNVLQPFDHADTISFGLVLIARYSRPNADPTEVGPPRQLRFNFPFVQLTQK